MNRRFDRTFLRCAFFAFLCGCNPAPQPNPELTVVAEQSPQSPVVFEDAATSLGVNSTFHSGREAGEYSILESLGGGAAAVDFDGDENVDLLFTNGGSLSDRTICGHPHVLYRNRAGSGFTAAAEVSNVKTARTYTQGCSISDFDSDGFPDLLITGYSGVQIYLNHGDGTFSEIESHGIDDTKWSSSAGWADFDADGNPDLYVTHYVDWSFSNHPVCPSPWPEHKQDVCPPRAFQGLADTLYFSQGDGTFADRSLDAGLRTDGKGLGVIVADLDHDGDADIYVANDMVENFLYDNDGSGHFTERGLLSGTATDFAGQPNGSMGLAVCDFNGDLKTDIWVTNFEQESFALYRNMGNAAYVHASREAGITALGHLYVGFGTVMADFNCDGLEDAVISNGHVVYYPTVSGVKQLPLLLLNQGDAKFRRSDGDSAGTYFSSTHAGRGLAAADVNNDGHLDLVASNVDEPAAVLINRTETAGSWIRFAMIGTKTSRDAVGTRMILKTTAGPQLRHVVSGGSFLSHHDDRIHFGIPEGAQLIGATVYWPSGKIQELDSVIEQTTNVVIEGRRNTTGI